MLSRTFLYYLEKVKYPKPIFSSTKCRYSPYCRQTLAEPHSIDLLRSASNRFWFKVWSLIIDLTIPTFCCVVSDRPITQASYLTNVSGKRAKRLVTTTRRNKCSTYPLDRSANNFCFTCIAWDGRHIFIDIPALLFKKLLEAVQSKLRDVISSNTYKKNKA